MARSRPPNTESIDLSITKGQLSVSPSAGRTWIEVLHGVTIDDAGFLRERHADRYLKPPEEMARLFLRYPEAVARTAEIAERCRFSLDELAYQYPREAVTPGLTPQQALEALTWEGAAARYPEGLPDKVAGNLRHELRLIERLDYAPYFLTVNSIVRFARSRDILCQGRGSAANSAVSTSSTSAARSSCSGYSRPTAAITPRSARR